MVYTIKPEANDQSTQEAEELHEYLVDQRGYTPYDIEIVATNDDTLEITVEPGIAIPESWPTDVQNKYCSLSKRERKHLDRRWCQPDRIRNALKE